MPIVQILELTPHLHPNYAAKAWCRKDLAVVVDQKIFFRTPHFNSRSRGPKSLYKKYLAQCEAEAKRIQTFIDLGVIK